MSPCQSLVSNGYCLAEEGVQYLVYLPSRGTVAVRVTGGPYNVQWINAQDTSDWRSGGSTADGQSLASPSDGDDWLLYLTSDGTPPPPPSATPTPTPTPTPAPGSFVLEAEGMALSGYMVDSNNADWIMVGSGSDRGEAVASFSAGDGTYSITINAIAENDGRPTLELWAGGTLQATFTYPLATSSNRFIRTAFAMTVATEVSWILCSQRYGLVAGRWRKRRKGRISRRGAVSGIPSPSQAPLSRLPRAQRSS